MDTQKLTKFFLDTALFLLKKYSKFNTTFFCDTKGATISSYIPLFNPASLMLKTVLFFLYTINLLKKYIGSLKNSSWRPNGATALLNTFFVC